MINKLSICLCLCTFILLSKTATSAVVCSVVGATADAPCPCNAPNVIISGICYTPAPPAVFCEAGQEGTPACMCNGVTIPIGSTCTTSGDVYPACAEAVPSTVPHCFCGTGPGMALMPEGKTCTAGASTDSVAGPLVPPNVNDYQWQGTPIILKTSQVFSGSEKRQCGTQEYEICVGPATHKTNATAPVFVVKCFIPKNQTACPTAISTNDNCRVADAATPSGAGVTPECDSAHPERDNLTYGCNCKKFGRENQLASPPPSRIFNFQRSRTNTR